MDTSAILDQSRILDDSTLEEESSPLDHSNADEPISDGKQVGKNTDETFESANVTFINVNVYIRVYS